MAVHQIIKLEGYVNIFNRRQKKLIALFRDLLIGRNGIFPGIQRLSPNWSIVITSGLFENKPAGTELRCGCVAVSTGEEAYSIAILLQEKLESLSHNDIPSGI